MAREMVDYVRAPMDCRTLCAITECADHGRVDIHDQSLRVRRIGRVRPRCDTCFAAGANGGTPARRDRFT